MANLGWLDVTDISFNALLLLEPLHAKYLAEQKPDIHMGTALKANPAVAWYLAQIHLTIRAYIESCLALADSDPAEDGVRQAEVTVLESMQDWLIYVLDPGQYDRLPFLSWEDSSLLSMADFSNQVVLDIGSGTGRLAFTVAPQAKTVYAVEPVANLRRFIHEKAKQLGADNVYPIDGRITQIPLADDFADILMAGHVFGEYLEQEYSEMQRVVREGGMILLHPGTNAANDNEAHQFLIAKGFDFDSFEEPGDGLKRKYWKTVQK